MPLCSRKSATPKVPIQNVYRLNKIIHESREDHSPYPFGRYIKLEYLYLYLFSLVDDIDCDSKEIATKNAPNLCITQWNWDPVKAKQATAVSAKVIYFLNNSTETITELWFAQNWENYFKLSCLTYKTHTTSNPAFLQPLPTKRCADSNLGVWAFWLSLDVAM